MFQMLLLCLVCSIDASAQKCINLKYDRCGNRTSLIIDDCGYEYGGAEDARTAVSDMYGDKEGENDILIYPNPNKGVFRIEIEDECLADRYIVQIYNNNGIMLRTECCNGDYDVDISDNPAGTYLLRIIKGDIVYGKIVVKL